MCFSGIHTTNERPYAPTGAMRNDDDDTTKEKSLQQKSFGFLTPLSPSRSNRCHKEVQINRSH